MEKASGIMIWQILGDAPSDLSLLGAINETAYGTRARVPTSDPAGR